MDVQGFPDAYWNITILRVRGEVLPRFMEQGVRVVVGFRKAHGCIQY